LSNVNREEHPVRSKGDHIVGQEWIELIAYLKRDASPRAIAARFNLAERTAYTWKKRFKDGTIPSDATGLI
jgi:Homeodomain-like domain-containing protein